MKFKRSKLSWKKCGIFFLILIAAVLCFSYWLKLMIPTIKRGEVTKLDTEAYQLVYPLNDYLPKDVLPTEGDCTLFGETADKYIMVYSGDTLNKDTVLMGIKSEKYFAYWAAKVSNQKVMEIWYSFSPLSPSDLTVYTDEDRFNAMHLQNPLKWPFSGYLDSSDAIGYAMIDNPDQNK